MSTRHIPPLVALVTESSHVDAGDLAAIAAALSKQVARDFEPVWGQPASVQSFPDPKRVPLGYWRIVIQDSLDDPNAAGYHQDEHGQPLAFVAWEGSVEDVATTCSHELLEALADPWGSRLVVATVPGAGRCRALVEVADPCESFTYEVDGLPLSDFVLPAYYGPHRWGKSVHTHAHGGLSYCGNIGSPLTVASGGYLSYVKPDGSWWQTTWFDGSGPSVREISARLAALPPQGSLRAAIDRVTSADAAHCIGSHRA